MDALDEETIQSHGLCLLDIMQFRPPVQRIGGFDAAYRNVVGI